MFGELLVDSHQLLMVTVATALQEIGYEIQVLRLQFVFGILYWKIGEFREKKMNGEPAKSSLSHYVCTDVGECGALCLEVMGNI